MAFDSSGRLVLASPTQIARVLPLTGVLDANFAGDGIYELPALPHNDPQLGEDNVELENLSLGKKGQITATRTYAVYALDHESFTCYRQTIRLTTSGTRDDAFASAGVLTETAASHKVVSVAYYTDTSSTLLGQSMLADGSLVRLMRRTTAGDNGSSASSDAKLKLERVSAAGAVGASVDLTTVLYASPRTALSSGGPYDGHGRLAVDANGQGYVIYDNRVLRFDAITLGLDAAFSGPEGATDNPIEMSSADIALDTKNRLLITGYVQDYDHKFDPFTVLAVAKTSAGVGGSGAFASLTANGVLDVNGTSGNDIVRLRRVGTKLEVNMNGKTKRYAFTAITGIVIHTGAGDDDIQSDVIGMAGGTTLQGGAGNDRITGTGLADQIDGGEGNDAIDGGAGDDVLTGSGGRDTLRGSEGSDQLFGGSGNDTLYASDPARSDDFVANYLFRGPGDDTAITAKHDDAYHIHDIVA